MSLKTSLVTAGDSSSWGEGEEGPWVEGKAGVQKCCNFKKKKEKGNIVVRKIGYKKFLNFFGIINTCLSCLLA